MTLQTGSWTHGTCGGADTILPGGKSRKPTQNPPPQKHWGAPGGFLLKGDRSKPPFIDWQSYTYPLWEQLTQTGWIPAFGSRLGMLPTTGEAWKCWQQLRPKDASGRWVFAVGPGPCARGTLGIHSDRNFQDQAAAFFQTQPSTREHSFSQILFVTPDTSPSDSQITCCLFITMLCTEFQEVHAAAAEPSLHISHSRALSLILKFIFYMITS